MDYSKQHPRTNFLQPLQVLLTKSLNRLYWKPFMRIWLDCGFTNQLPVRSTINYVCHHNMSKHQRQTTMIVVVTDRQTASLLLACSSTEISPETVGSEPVCVIRRLNSEKWMHVWVENNRISGVKMMTLQKITRDGLAGLKTTEKKVNSMREHIRESSLYAQNAQASLYLTHYVSFT